MNQIQCNKCGKLYRNLDAFWQHTETSKRCKPGGSLGGEMTVKEIVIEYLVKHGFDGLVSDDAECSCEIAGLMPCCFDNCSECKPGYKTECDCGEGCPFHIATQKDAK